MVLKVFLGFPFSLADSLATFNRSSGSIRNAVSNWFSYNYDGNRIPSLIADGGMDLFDRGNMVSIIV